MGAYLLLHVLRWVWLFATPWTVAHQVSLSMRFPRQVSWSRLPFPTTEDLPNPGIEPESLMSPALAGGFFTTSTSWESLGGGWKGILGRILEHLMGCGIAEEPGVFFLYLYIHTTWFLLNCDVILMFAIWGWHSLHRSRAQSPTRLPSDTSHKLWGSLATCIPEQLATTSEVSYEPFRLNNSLEPSMCACVSCFVVSDSLQPHRL